MLKLSSLAKWGAAALLLSSLTSCEDILEQYFPKPNPTPPTIPTFPPLGQDISFYALSGGNRLDAYSTANAATRISSVAITGLGSGETLLAIDFRPATGQLYGVSSASRLYVINQNTGVARAIGSGAFTPAVAGNLVGFDFNPTVDRIRLVTSTGQNLRLNPETGTVATTDGSINGAAGATLTGVAYTNNVAGASTTALYAINTQNQQLYLVNPPNDGTLVAVGNLNLPVSGNGGFDIDAKTGTALGLYTVNGNPTLFAVNLTSGAAQPLAQYAASTGYTGIAIPTQAVAYAVRDKSLLIFNPTNPSVIITKEVTGLLAGASFSGLDFRPANGQLYALATNHLYTLNAATGAATLVGQINTGVALGGGGCGFDFNPVADYIRITSQENSESKNIRVNPLDASAIVDRNLVSSDPTDLYRDKINAVAYDNNFAGATTTTLYAINSERVDFSIVSPPNEGKLNGLAIRMGLATATSFNGFDIGGTSNLGYAILSSGQSPETDIYTIDLRTKVGTGRRPFPGRVNGFTVGLGF